MNNNRKIYFHIDSGTSMDQIFALLDAVQSDNKDEINELMNDFDMEFIDSEVIKLLAIQTMWVFWHQKQLSVLLTKGHKNQ